MNPEPLKGKITNTWDGVVGETKNHVFEGFNKESVASAVRWLKEEINTHYWGLKDTPPPCVGKCHCHDDADKIKELIVEAFSDVMKEERE